MSDLLESCYLPLLAFNAVALIVIFAVGYAGRHRCAKWLLQVMLGLNTPAVMFIIVAILREAKATSAHQGAERGAPLGMLLVFSSPLFLEFLLLLAAWWRLRRPTLLDRRVRETHD